MIYSKYLDIFYNTFNVHPSLDWAWLTFEGCV